MIVGTRSEASSATGANGDENDNSSTYCGAADVFDLGDPVTAYCQQIKPTSVALRLITLPPVGSHEPAG